MDEAKQPKRLADQLRDHDEALWQRMEQDVLPRVLAALQRRFGLGRRWHDLEGFARSAQRVAWLHLASGKYAQLEELETLAQLEAWLVRVAARKFKDAVRRAEREETHAARLLRSQDQIALEELSWRSAAAVVEELEGFLPEETDRVVFRGKLEERTEAEISLQLRCSIRKVRGVWQRIRRRLARCS
jgi:hypothetical protein